MNIHYFKMRFGIPLLEAGIFQQCRFNIYKEQFVAKI